MVAALEPDSPHAPDVLLKGARLGDEATALAAGARNPRELLDRLLAADQVVDAAKVLLRALPKRYAVAWVCDCIRREFAAAASPPPPAETRCLEAAEAWLREDTDARRRAAGDCAAAADYSTPAAWVAAAAGWSGGSLAPPGYADVPPAEELTADACHAGVVLLAARVPAQLRARLRAWIERALGSFARSVAR